MSRAAPPSLGLFRHALRINDGAITHRCVSSLICILTSISQTGRFLFLELLSKGARGIYARCVFHGATKKGVTMGGLCHCSSGWKKEALAFFPLLSRVVLEKDLKASKSNGMVQQDGTEKKQCSTVAK